MFDRLWIRSDYWFLEAWVPFFCVVVEDKHLGIEATIDIKISNTKNCSKRSNRKED